MTTDDNLDDLIRAAAADVRARDFLWSAAIAAGIAVIIVASGVAPSIWLPLAAWVAFLASLAVRFWLSSGRDWARPVERIVKTQMSAKETELATLRLARGVAQALPEPLFILDAGGIIEHANPAAEEFIGVKGLEGRHFAAALRAPNVFEAAEDVAAGEPTRAVEFTTAGAVERHCRAFVAPVGEHRPVDRVLVFVRDLTSERRVEQMRADFIASASHELRTPLAALLGFIETLKGHAKDDPDARDRFLGIMQAQAERMQRLVSDLMSLSRIELREHVPPREIIELAALTEDVIDFLRPVLDQSKAIVDFENLGGGALRVIGEHDELFQAIQNLVDNALKYGGDPAMIKIRVGRGLAPAIADGGAVAHRAGDGAVQIAARLGVPVDDIAFVQVRDFGPGIERSDLPRLTERFYRVSIDRSKKAGGTGLGLAIVKHIMNRHRGGLQVESRLAAGTAFTCYLPTPSGGPAAT